jgi:multidrug efflux pump subunit AcrB
MKGNIFKNIASIFIKKKQIGILVIVFIIIFGVIGFAKMPKEYNPEIEQPAFAIVTVFPGATSEEVYELVTRPMEDNLETTVGIDEIRSTSTPGLSVVTTTFEVDYNGQQANTDLLQKIRGNTTNMPPRAKLPYIQEITVDDVSTITLAFTSDELSDASLRSVVWDVVDEIKRVPDTSVIEVTGGDNNGPVALLDIDKLATYGIGINEVLRAINVNNFHTASVDTDTLSRKTHIRIFGNIQDLESFKKIIVRNTPVSTIRIEDIADVEYGQKSYNDRVQFSTREEGIKNAVLVGVAKSKGTNITDVTENVITRIEELKDNGKIPAFVDVEVTRDDGLVAGNTISSLTVNLIQSIIIVSVILLLFLNTRSALLVSISIPLTLLIVFIVGFISGQALNRISLFALILSLGLLVDSSTVVVENMNRFLKERKNQKREEVITDAVGEVGGGLLMSALAVVFAFIPIILMTGTMGAYVRPIPIFVPTAIIGALFVALFISPFLGNTILVVEDESKKSEDKKKNLLEKMQNKSKSIIDKLSNAYIKIISVLFSNKRKRKVFLGVLIVLFVVAMAMPMFGVVRIQLLPRSDVNQFYVYLDMVNGTQVDDTEKVSQEISKILLEDADVMSVQTTVAHAPISDFNGMFKGASGRVGSHQATVKANLIDYKDDARNRQSTDIAQDARKRLENLGIQNNAIIQIVEDPPGPPVLATLFVKIRGTDYQNTREMRNIAQDIETKFYDIKGTVDIDTSQIEYSVEKVYRIKTEEAQRIGANVDDIVTALTVLTNGMDVTLYHDAIDDNEHFAQQHYISVRAKQDNRNSVEDILKTNIRTSVNSLAPLSELLEEVEAPIDDAITSDAQQPVVYVGAEVVNRSSLYATIDLIKYLVNDYRLPSGEATLTNWNLLTFDYEDVDGAQYQLEIKGEWKLLYQAFHDIIFILLIAVTLIYFVLVAQFSSFRLPLYIFLSLPFALVGVFFGFFLLYAINGTYFTSTSLIGIVALSGIVVGNAVMYLSYVLKFKEEGKYTIDEALSKTGKTRLLPIMLTTMTTALGSLTIVADPVWNGLAWAIIFGVILSPFITLMILPLIYRAFEQKNWSK